MIIRIFLILSLVVLVGYFLKSRATSRMKALKKVSIVLFALFGVATVLSPSIINDIAHTIGVGRGADLLVYLLTIAFLAYVLNQYLRSKDEERKFNKLARKFAILEAEIRSKNDTKH